MDNISFRNTPMRPRSHNNFWVNPNTQALQNLQALGERPARPVPEDCICQRPKKTVLCKSCGFMMNGRVRTVCPAHPQTIFLYDVEHCPKCLGQCALEEF